MKAASLAIALSSLVIPTSEENHVKVLLFVVDQNVYFLKVNVISNYDGNAHEMWAKMFYFTGKKSKMNLSINC